MDLTLLEVHLDDASFTANAPFSSDSDTDESDSAEFESNPEDEGPGLRALVPFVVGLAALAGIAYLVRRLRNGDGAATEIEPEVAEPDAPTP